MISDTLREAAADLAALDRQYQQDEIGDRQPLE
jgi:hypothetical protein